MGDIVPNIAKGRGIELHKRVNDNDPTNAALVLVLLQAVQADSFLLDYDSLDAILASSPSENLEADFTNYARITLTDSDIGDSAVDDSNDRHEADLADQTWLSAGGASNNTLVKLLICYDNDTGGGDDSNLIPVVALDFSITTNGSDLTAQFAATGYIRAA